MTPPLPPLLLASASPRRQELLSQAGVDFAVVVAEDAEPQRTLDEDCADFARRAAEAKALAVAAVHPGRLTLGADTIVVLDGEALGKPLDEADARRMLAGLSGRTHQVMTGIALALCCDGRSPELLSDVVVTDVTFRPLGDHEIAAYVATGEPLDKAGAYGIQGLGGALVAGYEGSYTNVVGLPLEAVGELLAAAAPVLRDPALALDSPALREAYITAKKACLAQ